MVSCRFCAFVRVCVQIYFGSRASFVCETISSRAENLIVEFSSFHFIRLQYSFSSNADFINISKTSFFCFHIFFLLFHFFFFFFQFRNIQVVSNATICETVIWYYFFFLLYLVSRIHLKWWNDDGKQIL